MRGRSGLVALTAAVAALALALLGAGCGGSARAGTAGSPGSQPAPVSRSALSLADLRVVPRVSRARSFTLPRDAVVSFDGPSAGGASFYLGHDSVVTFSTGGPPAGWHSEHVEISGGRVYVDGSVFPRVRVPRAARLLRVPPGTSGLIISSVSDRAALLFHRLAELHARVPAGRFPTGADLGDRIYYDPGWTSGFYAGALWQAAALEPAGGMFARWALAETLDHLGLERSPTHDVGFMYGQSSLNAWRALCGGSAGALAGLGSPALCARLRASVLSAADELLALAATNPGAGTIPTDPTSRLGDTIVDSMMNIAILPWASRVTGRAAYATLAARQARVIGSLLVRRDGSTAQAANFDRSSGRLLFIATHQGLSAHSTWSRGEAWALYGFSQAAVDLHNRALLAIALKVARYVGTHLPPGGVPRWDYDAPAGAPVDVSAGVITAAGFMHLAEACRQLGGSGCSGGDVAGFRALSRRMLAAALGYASAAAPLGLLRSQIQDERSRCWCNHGELIYGLSYALEALRLQLSLRS